jgi:hypothetical protein
MTSELLEVKPHDSVTLFLGTNSDTSTTFEISFFHQVFLVRGETEGLMVIRFIKAKNNRKPKKKYRWHFHNSLRSNRRHYQSTTSSTKIYTRPFIPEQATRLNKGTWHVSSVLKVLNPAERSKSSPTTCDAQMGSYIGCKI